MDTDSRQSSSRRWAGLVLWTAIALAATAVLVAARDALDKSHIALTYLLIVLLGASRIGRSGGFALALICFVAFNFFLLPQYGSLAAACNTLLCAVFVSVGYFIIVGKRIRVKLPVTILLKLFGLTLLLAGVFFGLDRVSGYWLLDGALAGIVFLGLVFLLRIVSLADLRGLRKA